MAVHSRIEGQEDGTEANIRDINLYLDNPRSSPEGKQAIGRLLERYKGSIYAIALRTIHNPQAAEEVTQAVMVHTLRKLQQLRDPRCFGGWIRIMTTRMALNQMAHPPRAWEAGDALDNIPAKSIEDPLLSEERRKGAQQGLDKLREADREVLEAFYLNGLSLKETAHRLKAPVGTIKRRLHYARNRLKDVISSEPVFAEDCL